MRTLIFSLTALLFLPPGATGAPIFESDFRGYKVPSYPYALAIVDIDDDGQEDLVVGCSSQRYVTLLRGLGQGSYSSVDSIEVPAARFMAVADLDRNGNLDIVTSGDVIGGGYATSVLLGHGDFTFDPPVDLPPGTGGGPLAVADLTGDNIPDLAVGRPSWDELQILAGQGDGSFGPPVSITATAASDLLALDLDADGDQDLAAMAPDTLEVLLNTGGGAFGTPTAYPVVGALLVAAGDLDSDGWPDLVSGPFWLRGLGGGAFADTLRFGENYSDGHAVVADFNLDGIPDILCENSNSALSPQPNHILKFYRGLGSGVFAAPAILPTGSSVLALEIGDLDGDPYPDFVTGVYEQSQVCVHRGLGANGVQSSFGLTLSGQPEDVLVADATGDGLRDVVAAGSAVTQVWVFAGRGDLSFDPPLELVTPFGVRRVAVGDVTGDQVPDLVAALNGGGLSFWAGTGGGTFSPRLDLATPAAVVDLALADIGQDGYDDVIACGTGLWVFPGGVSGPGPRADYASGGDRMRIGRLDADSYPDVVSAVSSQIRVRLGQSGGTLGPVTTTSGSSLTGGMALLDLDSDHDLDLVMTAVNANSFRSWLGDGAGGFAPGPFLRKAYFSNNLEVGDVDGDSYQDIVTASTFAYAASVTRTLGNGQSSTEAAYGSHGFVVDVALGDLDGDGAPELVTADTEGIAPAPPYRISVMRNTRGRLLDARPAPTPSHVALSAVWPNPVRSGGRARLAFVLPARGEVTIELYDVSGRRLARQALGPREPGRHSHDLALAPGWSPGLYWVRVVQAGAAAERRIVLTR